MSFLDNILGSDGLADIVSANWVAPAGTVAKAMSLGAHRKVVDASDRFTLTGGGTCWLVLSGALDLLWSDAAGRTFLARVEAGGLADAMTADDTDGGVVAIPVNDTELAVTSRKALAAHAAASPENRATVQSLWIGWMQTLSAAPGGNDDTPPAPAEAGAPQDWQARFDAINARVVAAARAGLSSRRTERRARADNIREATTRRFAAWLEQTAWLVDRRNRNITDGKDPFNAVAGIVFHAAGGAGEPADLVAPQDMDERDLVRRYARLNAMMSRTVTLEDDWWSSDHGPLLAFNAETRQPVALLHRPGGYDMVTGRSRVAVTARNADTIDRVVHVFQIPLPEGSLTPRRLFFYSLFGGGRDVRDIVFSLLLLGLFSLVTPLAIGWIMDPIIPRASVEQVVVVGLLLLLTALAAAITHVVQSLAMLRIEGQMENRVQGAVWIRLLSLPAAFFRTYTAGDLANRADSIDAMRSVLSEASGLLLTSLVSILFSFGLMLYLDWKVSLVALFVAFLFSVTAIVLGRTILSYNRRTLDLTGTVQGVVLQMVGAIGKLRVAGAERRAFMRWLTDYRMLVALSLRQRVLNNRLVVIRAVVPYIIMIAVLASIGFQMDILFAIFDETPPPIPPQASITTATFVSFNVALGQFGAAMFSLTRGFLHFFMLHPLYRRVRPILEAEPEAQLTFGHLGQVKGEIELRHVGFRYAPGAPLALKDVSFRAERGKVTAIVGPSGAGKSSVVRLILGFETPETGAVFIDDNDIRFVNKWDLRQSFGVVLQDGALLSGSVFDNVAAGLPLSNAEVTEAIGKAGLGAELASWPMGLHTQVGSGTAVLSRGQRQRLMIARAIVRQPKILLLDEATSALDNVSQALVMKNLKTMETTQIVIAHRLSTIVDADKIVVLDHGEVAEEGTFESLKAKGGLFARLVERQIQ